LTAVPVSCQSLSRIHPKRIERHRATGSPKKSRQHLERPRWLNQRPEAERPVAVLQAAAGKTGDGGNRTARDNAGAGAKPSGASRQRRDGMPVGCLGLFCPTDEAQRAETTGRAETMNHIRFLQSRVEEQQAELESLYGSIRWMREMLQSSKFATDTTVQVADVLRWLREAESDATVPVLVKNSESNQ